MHWREVSQLSKQRNANLKVSSGNLWEWLLASGESGFVFKCKVTAWFSHCLLTCIRGSALTCTSIWDNLRIYRSHSFFNGQQSSHVAHQNDLDRKTGSILNVSGIFPLLSLHFTSGVSGPLPGIEWVSLVQGLLKEVRLMNSTCKVSFFSRSKPQDVKWKSWIPYEKWALASTNFDFDHSICSIRFIKNLQKRSQTYWCFPIAVGLCLAVMVIGLVLGVSLPCHQFPQRLDADLMFARNNWWPNLKVKSLEKHHKSHDVFDSSCQCWTLEILWFDHFDVAPHLETKKAAHHRISSSKVEVLSKVRDQKWRFRKQKRKC